MDALVVQKCVPIHLSIHQTFIEHLLSTFGTPAACLGGRTQGGVGSLSPSHVGFFVLVIEVIMMEMVSLAPFK